MLFFLTNHGSIFTHLTNILLGVWSKYTTAMFETISLLLKEFGFVNLVVLSFNVKLCSVNYNSLSKAFGSGIKKSSKKRSRKGEI